MRTSAILLTTGLLMAAEPARAETCACEAPVRLAPADGATDVPTNVRLLVEGVTGDFRLRSAAGTLGLVARALRDDGRRGLLELDHGSLAPATSYEILLDGEPLAGFRTGAGPDQAAPTAPTELTVQPWAAEVSGPSGCDDDAFQLALAAEVEEAAAFEVVLTVDHQAPVTMTLLPEDLAELGTTNGAACAIAVPTDGEAYCVDLAAVDLAGNVGPTASVCGYRVDCDPIDTCQGGGTSQRGCDLEGCPYLAIADCAAAPAAPSEPWAVVVWLLAIGFAVVARHGTRRGPGNAGRLH